MMKQKNKLKSGSRAGETTKHGVCQLTGNDLNF